MQERVAHNTVVWNEEVDMPPENLYLESTPVLEPFILRRASVVANRTLRPNLNFRDGLNNPSRNGPLHFDKGYRGYGKIPVS